jgi:mevalonate kinase
VVNNGTFLFVEKKLLILALACSKIFKKLLMSPDVQDFSRGFSPAKLIITGEYSVMYGHIAIAIPVPSSDLRIQTIWKKLPFSGSVINITLKHREGGEKWQTCWQQVERNYQIIKERHCAFLQAEGRGENKSIKDANELIDCLIFLAKKSLSCKEKLKLTTSSYHLTIDSTIPIGSGLGSSAAIAAAVLQSINPELSDNQRFELACQSEDFAHGKSGLLDPWITVYNRPCLWQSRTATDIQLYPLNMLLIDTGKPQSSTANCVQQVRENFPQAHSIWIDFAKVSRAIAEKICQEKNGLSDDKERVNKLMELVKMNHILLQKIGVVPERVGTFIKEVEQLGCAAKITGAGSISGESGGAVIVFYGDDNAAILNSLYSLIKRYNYMRPLHKRYDK